MLVWEQISRPLSILGVLRRLIFKDTTMGNGVGVQSLL